MYQKTTVRAKELQKGDSFKIAGQLYKIRKTVEFNEFDNPVVHLENLADRAYRPMLVLDRTTLMTIWSKL